MLGQIAKLKVMANEIRKDEEFILMNRLRAEEILNNFHKKAMDIIEVCQKFFQKFITLVLEN